jgi:hypothetical protein
MRYFAMLLLILSGCAVQPKPFTGPDGRQAYAMRCGSHLDRCYEKAGQLCPSGGYDVIDRATGTIMSGNVAAPSHTLAIQCRN